MCKSYTKLKLLLSLGVFFLPLLAGGCNQDSIFDYISEETAPTEAKIKGSPSKMVKAGNKLYIANGRIWEYDLDGANWVRSAGPGGYVVDVASTSDSSGSVLYALTIDNTSTRVLKKNGTGWSPVAPDSDYPSIQNIFGAGDTLFATGAKRSGNDYAILSCKQPAEALVNPAPIGNAILTGVGKAGGNYYFATKGKGIYKAPDSDVSAISEASATKDVPDGNGNSILAPVPMDMAGFLQTKETDPIVGISKGGIIVYITGSDVTVYPTALGGTYTGALALMQSPDPQGIFDQLLLLGFKGSTSYKHGYVEVQFSSAAGTPDVTRRIPGANQPSSIQKEQQYTSSLRRYPATALWVLQAPDPKSPSVIFAATANQGLYSYRIRDTDWEWNHEE
ncbi:MAG: hypothetical protein LBK63_05205 [Treponema sp.]|jgi:hypothetical protein|nr:hypothetical protein [Treponema sp.]